MMCGLDVPEAKLENLSKTGSTFLIKCFDRDGEKRIPKKDLLELWKRIVFNMAVSNTDDHLKNHGFVLTNEGWHWMSRRHLD